MEHNQNDPIPPFEEEEEGDDHDTFSPRGTLIFVMIMLAGYVIYWYYLWRIVVLERG
jgi:hypothetical protein